MPKKTKKQKIAAQSRHIITIKNIEEPISQSLNNDSFSLKNTKSEESVAKVYNLKNNILQKEDEAIKSYFIADCKKSFIFIFFIIALEFFIYYASMNLEFLKLLKF